MARARKVCSHPSCARFAPCPDHTPKPWAGSTRRKRLPKGWEKLRRYILERDPICKDGRVCGGQALSTEVDHIVPNDDHSESNLQGTCHACHVLKSSREGNEAKRRAAGR